MGVQAETSGGSESELEVIPVTFTSSPLAGGRGQEGAPGTWGPGRGRVRARWDFT